MLKDQPLDKALEEEGKQLLDSVEKENGKPIILSRYGFRLMDFEGKKYVVAATPMEMAIQIADLEGRPVDEVLEELERPNIPRCVGEGPFNCIPIDGCGRCWSRYLGNGYYACYCAG